MRARPNGAWFPAEAADDFVDHLVEILIIHPQSDQLRVARAVDAVLGVA
jgi:hypothetical protein